MHLPQKLRDYLIENIPSLKVSPDDLVIIVTNSKTQFFAGQDLTFQEDYTIELAILNFTSNPLWFKFILIKWLIYNHPETVLEQNSGNLPMDITWNDKESADISLSIKISERLIAEPNNAGGFGISPIILPMDAMLKEELENMPLLRELYKNDDQIPFLKLSED